MVQNPPSDMPRITPHLFYEDIESAAAFLIEAFGFKTRWRLTDKNEKLVHVELEVEDSLVMLGLAEENEHWDSPKNMPKIHQRLFIYIDDVDAHYARAKAAGAKIVKELVDAFYGDRVYECVDPEGHYWRFAEHIEDVDLQSLKRPEDQ